MIRTTAERAIDGRTIFLRTAQALLLTPLIAAVFVLALIAASAMPNTRIADNLREDQEQFARARALSFTGRNKIDVGTECLGMSFGLPIIDGDASAYQRAIRAPVFPDCPTLNAYLATGVPSETLDYYRYWNGYAAVSRPLLSIVPYRDLRMITFNAVAFLLFLSGLTLYRDFGARFALAVLLPFYFVNFAGFFILWTKAVSWIIALGAALYLANARRPYERDPCLAFFVIGAMTAFFDLLTTPLLIFGFPAYIYFFYLLKRREGLAPRALLGRLALIAGFWFAGYAGLWVVKCGLAAQLLGPSALREIASTALFRVNGPWESVKHFPGAAILENIEVFKAFWGAASILAFVVLPLATAKGRRSAFALFKRAPVFAALAIAPFAWFEILSNHSQIHGLYTHAILILTFIPMSLVLFGVTDRVLDSGAPPIDSTGKQ